MVGALALLHAGRHADLVVGAAGEVERAFLRGLPVLGVGAHHVAEEVLRSSEREAHALAGDGAVLERVVQLRKGLAGIGRHQQLADARPYAVAAQHGARLRR